MRSFFIFHTRTAFAACLLLGGGPAAKRGSTSPVFGSNRTMVFGLTPDFLSCQLSFRTINTNSRRV